MGAWLVPFFQIASEGVAKENAKTIFENITFIVFNYDRCIERFFSVALKLYYDLSDQESADIARSLHIIHPYGQVGHISPSPFGDLESVPFGADRFDLKKVVESIRTFSEGLHNPEQKSTISEVLQNAEQILFLGFAFHPLNMILLATKPVSNIERIFGTTIGLSEPAVRAV